MVGVLGASSLVGRCLLQRLSDIEIDVVAFTRKEEYVDQNTKNTIWRLLYNPEAREDKISIRNWICLIPIWVLPDYFEFLQHYGIHRIVVLSSTSRFTKKASTEMAEQQIANRLAQGEERLKFWAQDNGIEWLILRPTMIYGLGKDKNVSSIARFIKRFGFFPVVGSAQGLRQPVHAMDVAQACSNALLSDKLKNKSYNISGAEVVPYREMVSRVFCAMNKKPRILRFPLFLFKLSVGLLRFIPRYRHLSSAMVERMNADLVFDHGNASQDFAYLPRAFRLDSDDIPK